MNQKIIACAALSALSLAAFAPCADAQNVETVGSRALGMGGAFVAVASDSTATWWNPAGLAAGPFLDLSLATALTEMSQALPAHRDTATWLALGTPPFGASYYRFRLTNVRASDPTVTESGNRQEEGAEVPVQSLAGSQLGITLVQTLLPGLHAGATLKHVRGTLRNERGDGLLPAGELLERGDALDGGEADRAFDADLGVIGIAGALRLGLLVRNAFEAELGNEAGTVRFDRQFRVGAAYDASAVGGPPLMVALDADVDTLATPSGDRRNLAVGAEQWLWNRRLGVRGGARFNTVGAKERAATAGASVVVRAGLFVEAHVVRGGREDDRGWGVGARVSF